MRLGLKGRIAKTFDQVFVGGMGDAAWKGQGSERMLADWMSPHTVFIISQSHSVEVCAKPAVSCAQAVESDPCFARHPGGELLKQEIYGFEESDTGGGGVVLVSEILHERS